MALLSLIESCLRENPGITAGNIAKILSVTRNEVNSLLYRNNKKLFTRIDNGEKAPTWIIFDANFSTQSKVNTVATAPFNENPGKAALKRIIEKIEVELSNKQKFETRTGATKLEVVLVPEGVNSHFTRYEILDVDDLIIIVNEDSLINDTSITSSEKSIAFHVLHCIADCLAQYKIKRTEVLEEEFIPIKSEILIKLLSLSF